MNNNNIDKQKLINAIIASTGGKIDRSTLSNAASGNDLSALMQTLSPEDKQKLSSVLSDKSSLASILSSSEARSILKSFLKGGGKNG